VQLNHTGLAGLALLALFAAGTVSYAQAQTVSVYAQGMPRHWQDEFGSTLLDAMSYWEKTIPGLKFELASRMEASDFVVEWASQNEKAKLGYYSTSDLNSYGKPVMAVTLGFFDGGKLQMLSPESALEVTKHELGHAIGMQHSANPDDVMYHTVDDFESLYSVVQVLDGPKNPHAASTKYQELAGSLVVPLEGKITAAKASLGVFSYGNNASDQILEDSWLAYWWAVKYLDYAEKAQMSGGASALQSDYEKSYAEFKAAYEYANLVEQKLALVDENIAKMNALK